MTQKGFDLGALKSSAFVVGFPILGSILQIIILPFVYDSPDSLGTHSNITTRSLLVFVTSGFSWYKIFEFLKRRTRAKYAKTSFKHFLWIATRKLSVHCVAKHGSHPKLSGKFSSCCLFFTQLTAWESGLKAQVWKLISAIWKNFIFQNSSRPTIL